MMLFLINLPLLFMSNALYPLASLPTWMEVCARLNPTSYVVDGMRQMVFKNGADLAAGDVLSLWLCFVVVFAFTILGMLLAFTAFKKSIK
jgi:ABC-2 type transport system permease protein